MNKDNLIVISLGGSLIFPEKIDVLFLKTFRGLLINQVKLGQKFILITGGGKICRKYQQALSQLTKVKTKQLDWMGIYTTHTNAQLVRLMLENLALPKIITNPIKKEGFKQQIMVAAGWKPGWSTDYVAVNLAKTYKASTVINLSNIDFLYNKDPRKFQNAEKIKTIDWEGLLRITGKKWRPGANTPFDPIAAQFAKKHKLKVIIANGKNLTNLKNILNNKAFEGTVIE